MKIGTIVKPTKKIAYHWRYKVGIVVLVGDAGVHTHYVQWDNGDKTYEKPSALEVIE